MISENDITGDLLATKPNSESFRDGHERIFGKRERKQWVPPPLPCDMGEMCLDCQPRGANGECPDKKTP
jgi:hypothetical protein